MRTAHLSEQFTASDRRHLALELRRTHDLRFFKRLQALLLVAQGHSPRLVAMTVQVALSSVYLWTHRFLKTRQCRGLRDASRSGRPPLARLLNKTFLLGVLARSPLQLGYSATTWTVELLATHLHRIHGWRLSGHTLRRRMRAAGLKSTGPPKAS